MEAQDPLAGTNLAYVEELYARYLADPGSVDADWQRYFAGLGSGLDNGGLDAPAARRAVDGPSLRPASIFHGAAASAPAPSVAQLLPPLERPAAPAVSGPAGSGLPEVPRPILDERVRFLRGVEMFRDIPDAELELVARLSEELPVGDGTFLFRQGDPGDSLFLVIRGELIVRRRDGIVVPLAPGQVVGELAVFTAQPRVADVIARGDVRVMKVRREDLMALIKRRPSLAEGFLRMLSNRLRQSLSRQDKVNQLIHAHRVRGHLLAKLDPLGQPRGSNPELELAHYGLEESDLDSLFSATMLGAAVRGGAGDRAAMTLRDILGLLHKVYCDEIGVQYMHIDDVRAKIWIQSRMEDLSAHRHLGRDEQLRILTKLTDAELFEQFIHRKFLGAKRFSLEGAESLIPLVDLTIEDAGRHGVREVVIGMAHRGRLNVLVNVLGKSAADVFREFADADADEYIGRGDVKYHLGYSSDVQTTGGQDVHLSLCFNPSHLECVDPVALGRVRSKQDRFGDREHRRGLAILIHGDAAFAGQGVIQELFNMSDLDGYRTGGTVHIIVNNQIGFTTPPERSRSTTYATDVARMLQTPVFHVNGESPEAVAQVVRWAMDYRAEFGTDIVIDMYCYRRYGHNEGDEPAYTQPLLYDVIKKRKSVRDGYLEHLLAFGEVTREEADEIAVRRKEQLEEELSRSRAPGFVKRQEPAEDAWKRYRGGADAETPEAETGAPKEKLAELLRATTQVREGFTLHRKLKNLMKGRLEMADGKHPLDWAAGEALALASLLVEGHPVRFTGQDATRGTFSHRHSRFHDVKTGAAYMPLRHLSEDQARLQIWDSPLSEVGVLGFEYGYSLDTPEGLVVWEAQFGDFCNVAQMIIDQFISSSEDKWNRLSGLVMLLPHGFEGQGPEHSSARLERFLNLAAEDNMQIVNLTTPAQLFHCLRRQVLRPLRKPLVVMSPKSLLRHPEAVSSLDELAEGSFQRILPDASGVDPKAVTKVLLCSGKVYYELAAARRERERDDVAILRMEQYYPISRATLHEALSPYADGTSVVWVQEEPANMGARPFVLLHVAGLLDGRWPLATVSRPASASPATGSAAAHKKEQALVIDEALG